MGLSILIIMIVGASALYSILMSIGILLGYTLTVDTPIYVLIYINFIVGAVAFLMFTYKTFNFINYGIGLLYTLKDKAAFIKVIKEYPNGFPKGTLIIMNKEDEYLKYLARFDKDILRITTLEHIAIAYMPENLQDLTTQLDKT